MPAFWPSSPAKWSNGQTQSDARHHLSVLLRRLIHSTGNQLRRVDFPGYDNAERHGWDGFVEAGAATAWIPEGLSGWEFGVDGEPLRKAEKDYAGAAEVGAARGEGELHVRIRHAPELERTRTIGPPRRIRAANGRPCGRTTRATSNNGSRSPSPRQIWLAERLRLPITGFETLGHCLDRWTHGSHPRCRARSSSRRSPRTAPLS